MRNIAAVLLYPGCIYFEIALVTEVLARSCDVLHFTPDGTRHLASNGARIEADGSYADLEVSDVICMLVPGGDPGSIIPAQRASAALQRAAARGALLAGICAGTLVLASAGLLKGVRATHNYTAEHAPEDKVADAAPYWNGILFERADIVEDGKRTTAQPWAYVQFAAIVARHLGFFSAEQASDFVDCQRRSYDPPRASPVLSNQP